MEVNNDNTMANHVHQHEPMQNKFGAYNDEKQNNGHVNIATHSHSGGFSMVTTSDFLIEGISIASIEGTVLAIVFTLLVTITHDVLKVVLHQWKPQAADQSAYKKKEKSVLFLKTIIHLMSVFLAYIAMLCVMTMNMWLIISVVCGSGIAHLLIRPFLYDKLNHSRKRQKYIVKENVELLHGTNECQEES